MRRSDILENLFVRGKKRLPCDSWSVTSTLTHFVEDTRTYYSDLMHESLTLSFGGSVTYPTNDKGKAEAKNALASEIQRVMYQDIVKKLIPLVSALECRSIERDDVVRELKELLSDLTE